MFLPVIDQEAYNLFDAPQLTGTPERRLLLAILERAILDYVGNDVTEVSSSEEWLFSELDEPSMEEFTFPWVCQQLDLDIYRIAQTIRAMPRRGNHRIAPWYFMKNSEKDSSNEKQKLITRDFSPRRSNTKVASMGY